MATTAQYTDPETGFSNDLLDYLRQPPLEQARWRIDDYLAGEQGRRATGRPQTFDERVDAILRRAEGRILADRDLSTPLKVAAIDQLLDASVYAFNGHLGRASYRQEEHVQDVAARVHQILRRFVGTRRRH